MLYQLSPSAEAYRRYTEAPVGNHLVSPCIPDSGPVLVDELHTPEDIRKKANVVHEDERTDMALVNKRYAHAVREVMWMHEGEQPIATLGHYFDNDPSGEKSQRLFSQMAACAIAAEEMGDHVALSWSNDPETHHRASIQGEKRLHFHLTSRKEELDVLPEVTTTVGELGFVDRRRLAEEYGFATSAYLFDVIAARPALDLQTEPIHPTVLSVEIGDWPDLAKPAGIAKVARTLQLMEQQYQSITEKLGGEDQYGRIDFDNAADTYEAVKAVSGLDNSSLGLNLLTSYIDKIKTAPNRLAVPQQMTGDLKSRRKNFFNAVIPTKGFSYAGNFSKYDDTLYLHIRPSLFSDLGGSGCAFLEGMPVRVKKGTEPMTEDQLDQRRIFVAQAADIAKADTIEASARSSDALRDRFIAAKLPRQQNRTTQSPYSLTELV